MRSISPKRIPAPLKLLSGPINVCQERVRMKSPASRRAKYILNEQTETYAIPQIAQKEVFRIKKFQSIKGVQKAKLNIFNSETLSPRIGKRSQRPKQDLSSILSHKEIIVMRAKIMNDFTSLL